MIGYYNYSVITTYLGLAFGVYGINLALEGHLMGSLICLMLAGFCDMIDGTIACTVPNRSDEAKAFGIQIDSLCDIVCFGVLPAILCYSLSVVNATGIMKIFGIVSMYLYILAQVVRLGFFNVQEALRQKQTSERRKYYTGLPVTSAAIIVPTIIFIAQRLNGPLNIVMNIMLLVLSILFVSKVHIGKPATRGKLLLSVLGGILIIAYIVKGKL